MSKVLVIAGTTDAKTVIERLLEKNHDTAVTVTTRLGAGMLDEFKNLDDQGEPDEKNWRRSER